MGNLGGELERSKRLTVVDVTLLVLAGGRGTRFGLLNTNLPKSAIPVYDESSLVRNVRQTATGHYHPCQVVLDKVVRFGGLDLQLTSILEGKDHCDFTPFKKNSIFNKRCHCPDLDSDMSTFI